MAIRVLVAGRRTLGALLLALAAARLSAAMPAPLAAATRTVTITVLHTSDLHGHVDPRDNPEERGFREGLAGVATAVKAVRAEGGRVLLLDSGDTIEGAPVEAMVFSGAIPDRGDPIVRAMNLVGYDVMTVGNHEFNFGRQRLEKSRREAKVPWAPPNTPPAGSHPGLSPAPA